MPKKIILSENHQCVHDGFYAYLQSIGHKGKGPQHLCESLERRVHLLIRKLADASFTNVYDYNNVDSLQKILDMVKDNQLWIEENKRHGDTYKRSMEQYIDYCKYKQGRDAGLPILHIKEYRELEGAKHEDICTRYERNQDLRNVCIQHYGYKCYICGFDFEKTYGELGREFIEIHHLKPLSDIDKEHITDPINGLRPLCSNCHSMVHRKDPPLDIEDLRSLLK